jgi:hypothetical protein
MEHTAAAAAAAAIAAAAAAVVVVTAICTQLLQLTYCFLRSSNATPRDINSSSKQ